MESSPKPTVPVSAESAATAIAEGDLDGAVRQASALARNGGEDGCRQALGVLDAVLRVSELNLPGLLERSRLRAESGDRVGAITDAASAVAADPKSAEAYGLLAGHMADVGRLDEAMLFAYEALKAAPWDPARFVALADLFRRQKTFASAEELLRAASPLAPHDAHIVLAHMDCLAHLDRPGEAVEIAKAARERFADHPEFLSGLGDALVAAGRSDEALAVFRDASRRMPEAGYAKHMIAVLSGVTPERAEPDYVRAVFDRIAPEFDDLMLQTQRHRGPAVIARAVQRFTGKAGLRILDLGCGTGLCGVMLRDTAAHLTGIDLSPAMAALARAKGVYETIEVADIAEMPGGEAGIFDVVVAGDTLAYFGALEALLRRIRAQLRPGGLLVFTVEAAPDPVPYRMTPDGTFAHGRAELRRLAGNCGFEVLCLDDENLRVRGGKPVRGLLAAFRSV